TADRVVRTHLRAARGQPPDPAQRRVCRAGRHGIRTHRPARLRADRSPCTMSNKTSARDWIRPGILALKPYRVAHAGGQVKLDAMENPWPLPESLRAAWEERIASVLLNRYPDPGAHALAPLLRRVMGIPKEMELLIGNG